MGTATTQNSFIHTVEDIEKLTGLKLRTVRDYRSSLADRLAPFCQKGDKGRDYFDNNGLIIFKRVKALADNGRQKNKIIQQIQEEFTGSTETSREAQGSAKETAQETKSDSRNASDPFHMLERLYREEKVERKGLQSELERLKLQLSIHEKNTLLLENTEQRISREKKERLELLEQVEGMMPWWRRGRFRKVRQKFLSLDMGGGEQRTTQQEA